MLRRIALGDQFNSDSFGWENDFEWRAGGEPIRP